MLGVLERLSPKQARLVAILIPGKDPFDAFEQSGSFEENKDQCGTGCSFMLI